MLRKSKKADRGWIRRGLCAEQLEPRAMLAGNVTATVSGSTLIVRGDSRDNEVAIVQVNDGEYAVVGLNGTDVNRREDDEAVFVTSDRNDNFIRNIVVDLGSGDDVLSVGNDPASLVEDFEDFGVDVSGVDVDALQEDLDEAGAPAEFSLDGTLSVRMGNGNDAVAVIANVGGSVVVDLGSGSSNSFSFDGTSLDGGDEGGDDDGATVGGSLIAKASSGVNSIRVEGAAIGGSAVITTGKGGDFIDIADISVRHSLVINSGSGGDEVFVHTHDGPGTHIGAALVINAGSGNDLIDVEAVSVDGSATILLGSGDDTLDAANVNVGINAIVNAGSGDDAVSIDASEVDNLFLAIMGSGRDRLEIASSSANLIGLNGGSGEDTLIADFNENDERVLYIISFEKDEDDPVPA